MKLSEIRKAAIALLGSGGPLGAAIADPNAGTITAAIVAVCTVLGVWRVRNARPIPEVPPAGFLSPRGDRPCGNGCSCVKAPSR